MTVREHHVSRYAELMDIDTQLVDVREPAELQRGTLPGAVNIPLGDLPHRMAELDPNRRVLLLCRSGNRSGHAARFLAQQGFGDVVNLAGGIAAVGDLRTVA
jgi:rhodanese-related sulfurtransferase